MDARGVRNTAAAFFHARPWGSGCEVPEILCNLPQCHCVHDSNPGAEAVLHRYESDEFARQHLPCELACTGLLAVQKLDALRHEKGRYKSWLNRQIVTVPRDMPSRCGTLHLIS